jgi:PRTRC genetic system protein E
MKTNFFNQIAVINQPGIWKMTVQNDDKGNFTVSLLFNTLNCGDNAVNSITPMVLKGTATELGEGFFDTITQPVIKTAGLMNNMEEYLKTVEKARLASKEEQDKKNKEKADKSKGDKGKGDKSDSAKTPAPPDEDKAQKKKAYFDAIKEIFYLDAKCQYEEALAILPSVADYPEKEAELTKRKLDLEKKAEQKKNLLFT